MLVTPALYALVEVVANRGAQELTVLALLKHRLVVVCVKKVTLARGLGLESQPVRSSFHMISIRGCSSCWNWTLTCSQGSPRSISSLTLACLDLIDLM